MTGSKDPDDARVPGKPLGRKGGPAASKDEIEESLHEALSDLEQMLQRHQGARGEREPPPPADDEQQYTIPLLEEVVIPGAPAAAQRDPSPASTRDAAPETDDEPSLRRRLAARIASEIEVIVQDRMEAALERARAEITAQVRNHLDITLPEIVDELAQRRRRDE